MTRIVVGIVTYNSAAHWPACYAALQTQTRYGMPLPLDIRIYDNASSDTTVAEIRRLAPDLPLTLSPINRGYGAAHNALIAAANFQHDDFYLALNPDSVLQEGYIAHLIRVLHNDPWAGWATGALYRPDRRVYSLGHGLRRDGFAINIAQGMEAPTDTKPFEIFGAPGAAVLIKRQLLGEVGMPFLGRVFDETFFVYNEDVDFDWRARRHGWRCWCIPEAKAIHEGSLADAEGQARAVVNRWLMIFKNAAEWDMLVYHMPHWIAHVLLRLCITPRWGLWMLKRFFRHLPHAWQARRADPPVSDRGMTEWFARADKQPTMQPKSYWQRWQALRKRL